jgi:hypothetical protein
MTDKEAIECICMILSLSKEEVEQEHPQLRTPHSWHDVVIKVIKRFGTTYTDDTNMYEEEY